MKRKLKHWLIRKLGGIVESDLPWDIQVRLMQWRTRTMNTMWAKVVLDKGFKTDKSI